MHAVYFSRPISLPLCSGKFRIIDFVIMVRYRHRQQIFFKKLKFRGALNLGKNLICSLRAVRNAKYTFTLKGPVTHVLVKTRNI